MNFFTRDTDPKIDFDRVDQGALKMLDEARKLAGIPFKITSHYRTPEHSVEVGGLLADSHTEEPFCSAFDIAYDDKPSRARIIYALATAGFRRIGINERNGHVHCDASTRLPSPAFWIEA